MVWSGFGPLAAAGPADLWLTNICQLQQVSTTPVNYQIQLEGNVWWASPDAGTVVLEDATGAAELETDLAAPAAQAGERVRLTGNGTVKKTGRGYRIGVRGPVVDNNGVHEMVEKSGAVFLKAGWQPLQIDWFNGVEKFGLVVEFAGPNLPRQKIPAAALFRKESGTTNLVSGLNYICCAADD